MSDLTDTDFPPLDPQPFVTEEGREIERLRAELAAVQKQRDEARREVCKLAAINRLSLQKHLQIVSPDHIREIARQIAAERGWDCFAEKEWGGA